MTPLFGVFEGLFAPQHILLVLVIGILFFGKRLPEIARSLGKGVVEFKKGLKGIEDEVDGSMTPRQEAPAPTLEAPKPPQRVTMTVPKFEDNPHNVTPPSA
jgi:sec-independent protein translocase protein TatA